MKAVVGGVSTSSFPAQTVDCLVFGNLGNNEEQYYTRNRQENARCELFPGSGNGRLIIEARKVSGRFSREKKHGFPS